MIMLLVIEESLASQVCPNILVTTCMKCKNEENYQLMRISEYDIYLYIYQLNYPSSRQMLDDLKVSKSLVCNQDTSLYNNNVRIVCLVKRR